MDADVYMCEGRGVDDGLLDWPHVESMIGGEGCKTVSLSTSKPMRAQTTQQTRIHPITQILSPNGRLQLHCRSLDGRQLQVAEVSWTKVPEGVESIGR